MSHRQDDQFGILVSDIRASRNIEEPRAFFDPPLHDALALAHRDPATDSILSMLGRGCIARPTPVLTKHVRLYPGALVTAHRLSSFHGDKTITKDGDNFKADLRWIGHTHDLRQLQNLTT